jgi:predicted nucleotidyltransferase
MPEHGLTPRQMETMKSILAPYADVITRVDLFGSRATGAYRPNSDIDLMLRGPVGEQVVNRLWTLFAESSLPFKVDVKSEALTVYPPLKAHVEAVCKPLFTQQELQAANNEEKISHKGVKDVYDYPEY